MLGPIIYVATTEALSFETVQTLLVQGITQSPAQSDAHSLNTLLRGLEKLNKRVVLVCDDAALMFPGLITTFNAICSGISVFESGVCIIRR